MPRRILIGLALAALLPVGLLLLGWVLLPRLDLAGLAAARAQSALGRPVAVASLRITPGRWLRLDLEGLRIDTIAGGTRPEMLRLGRAALELDLLSLLRGPPVLRGVAVEDLCLLLERTADRTPNWRFGPQQPATHGPPDRSGLPLLRDATLRNGEVLVRTSRGHLLRTRIDRASVRVEDRAAEAAAPVLLRAEGAYNGVPVTLDGRLDSTAALRDAARPVATVLHLASGNTRLTFDGHMEDPFNLEGADGRAVLRAPTPEAILALAGAEAEFDASLALAGRLEHRGDLWRLSEAAGELAGEALIVREARFTEGQPGRPDAVALDLGFARLDLNGRLGSGHRADPRSSPGSDPGSGPGQADLPLSISAAPDPLLEARITVADLAYAGLDARDVAFHGALTPGRIAVQTFALTTAGARLRASGEVEAKGEGGEGGAVAAEVRLEDGEIETMRRALGLRALPVSGRLDGWVAVTAEGRTLNAAARGARVSAVLAMPGGRIAREVIEMGSTDIRLLFREARGTTPVSCLLAVLEMEAGRGEVAPLRVRSAEGTIAGTANFDLNRKQLDLVIGSLRRTTGFWALDIPVRVSGRFGDPSVLPARWSADGRARLAAADEVAPLPARLRDVARRNACYQATSIPAAPPRAARPRTTSRSRPR